MDMTTTQCPEKDASLKTPPVEKLDSVVGYLDSLTWDQVPRIDHWLIDHAGAEDTVAVRTAGRVILIAAVRRARQPGCRFDFLPVIVGPQGCCKSSALRLMAVNDEWFSDEAPIERDDIRRLIEVTEGKWIVEAPELEGIQQSSSLKNCIARSVDVARLAYQRQVTRVPRRFVLIGTSGSPDYLRDTTGNRRFWPMAHVRRFNLKSLAQVRDQLWAEAVVAERAAGSRIGPEAS